MQADAATRAGAACHAARGARRYGAAAAPLRLCRHATALLRAPTRYVVAAVSRRAARSARSAAAQRALMSFFTFLIFDIAFRAVFAIDSRHYFQLTPLHYAMAPFAAILPTPPFRH
jgi:hypothetical protein